MIKAHVIGSTLLAAAVLAGCNGSSSDNSDSGGSTTATDTTTSLTVTPSLGKIVNAHVTALTPAGVKLGEGVTGNDGSATLTVSTTDGPVIIEVAGDAGAKYYDESKAAEVDFGAGHKLRAVLPGQEANATVGVSALTEIAYQVAEKKAGGLAGLNAGHATAANNAVRQALAPALSSITIAPRVIGSAADLATLQNDDASRYALTLDALAKLQPGTAATPALTALQQLAADIVSDDKLDGVATGQGALAYTAANLGTKIIASLNATIATANLGGLGLDVNTFKPVLIVSSGINAHATNIADAGDFTGANGTYTGTGSRTVNSVPGDEVTCTLTVNNGTLTVAGGGVTYSAVLNGEEDEDTISVNTATHTTQVEAFSDSSTFVDVILVDNVIVQASGGVDGPAENSLYCEISQN